MNGDTLTSIADLFGIKSLYLGMEKLGGKLIIFVTLLAFSAVNGDTVAAVGHNGVIFNQFEGFFSHRCPCFCV